MSSSRAGVVSSALPPSARCPSAPTVLVYTTRRTPASAQAARTQRVPSTLLRYSSAGPGAPTRESAAQWNTASHPATARRIARGSATSPTTRSTGSPSRRSIREVGRTRHRTASPRASRAWTTCAPTNPVPPVTRFIPRCPSTEVPQGHPRQVLRVSGQLPHRGRLEPRVHRAVLARSILPGLPVVPVGAVPELLPVERQRAAHEIARALPSPRGEGDRAPRRAAVIAQARRELQEHRRGL